MVKAVLRRWTVTIRRSRVESKFLSNQECLYVYFVAMFCVERVSFSFVRI